MHVLAARLRYFGTMKASGMLDFSKRVLAKVSFDRHLFSKELRKCLAYLNREELRSLRDWCLGRYGSRYGDVIDEAFAGLALA
jgi:hypothetical protein